MFTVNISIQTSVNIAFNLPCVCLHTYLCYIDEISYKMIRCGLVGSINNLHIFLHALFKTNNLKKNKRFCAFEMKNSIEYSSVKWVCFLLFVYKDLILLYQLPQYQQNEQSPLTSNH